jgi:hypothetical protein
MPKRTWQDRIVQYPRRFKIIDNNDGTVTMEPQPGTIVQPGTFANAVMMNGIENDLGDLTTLNTTNKTTLVSAINEAFQFANDGKTAVANAVLQRV